MRSRVAGAILAVLLGGLLGYIALILREMGWAIAVVVAALLTAFYWSRGRRSDVGWVLVGLGVVPSTILGRNGLVASVDPAMEVGFDTWLMLGVALAIAAFGALVVFATAGDRSRPDRSPG